MYLKGNFVDFVRITMDGGRGGNGASAFERSSMNPRGKPSGGNGGRGGSVLFYPNPFKTTLEHLPKILKAASGDKGQKNMMFGANGADLSIGVPLGTLLRDVTETDGENKLDRWREINFDSVDMEPITICKGGRGGKGNYAVGKNNQEYEIGLSGERRTIEVDLKTLADVGLVGLPNAGKSSFLSAVSNAHPKIAPYPFTTLNPFVGTVHFTDLSYFTIADIPGLIEGAHRNIGLGHHFLKHVVKSKILAFVIDFARPEPWMDYNVLVSELNSYKKGLAWKCRLVIANKADLVKDIEKVVGEFHAKISSNVTVLPVSSKNKSGLSEATHFIKALI